MSRHLIITAGLSLLVASSAFAGDNPMVATLAARTLPQKQLVGSNVWRCADTTCTSVSKPETTGVTACREIAKRFGQVSAFTSVDGDLSADQLSKCNEGIQAK